MRARSVLFALSFLIGCHGKPPQTPKPEVAASEVKAAEEALDRKDRSAAEVHARAALKADPKSLEALLMLARIVGPTKPESLDLLQRAIGVAPKDPQAYSLLADALLRQGKRAEAKRTAEKGLSIEASPSLYVILGIAEVAESNFDTAIENFQKALTLAPNSISTRLMLASAYESQGNLQGAIEIYADTLQLDPSNPMARMGAAEIFLKVDAPAEALVALEGIQWKDTPPAPYFAVLGSAYSEVERYPEAAAAFSTALSLESDRAEYAVGAARALFFADDNPGAQEILEKALARWPEHVELLITYGQTLIETQPKKASEVLQRALVLDPTNRLGLHVAASAARFQKDYTTALAHLTLLAAANPEDAFVLLEMGNIYQEAGNPSAAEQSYKDARAINPKDPRPGLALARLFNESDPARALSEIDDVLVRNPENLLALSLRAQLLIGLKRRPDALATFEEALALAPTDSTINNNFAWALVYNLDPKDRNCERGLSLAQRAVEGSRRQEPSHLDTLAEAYRCGGNYDQALSTIDEALALEPGNDFYKTHRAEIAAEKAKPPKGKSKKGKK